VIVHIVSPNKIFDILPVDVMRSTSTCNHLTLSDASTEGGGWIASGLHTATIKHSLLDRRVTASQSIGGLSIKIVVPDKIFDLIFKR
jgi:hypothetical protein